MEYFGVLKLHETLEAVGISLQKLLILMHIEKETDKKAQVRIVDLVKITGHTFAATSNMTDYMERDGLVQKHRVTNDKRAMMIKLMPKGIEALKQYGKLNP